MTILVIGYFRAGQVWLTRLLAQSLMCPVRTYLPQDRGRDVAVEGSSRISPHQITRSHSIEPEGLPHDHIVYIVRDPRDSAVSISHYPIAGIDNAVTAICDHWQEHIERFYDQSTAICRYEDLHADAPGTIKDVLNACGLDDASDEQIRQAVHDQEFSRKRTGIITGRAEYGFDVSWNERHMRKGIVGEWKSVLSDDHVSNIRQSCERYMQVFDYL